MTGPQKRFPLSAPCGHCGSTKTFIEWHPEAEPGTGAAAAYDAVAATEWPYAVCDGCGHESRGDDPAHQ